VAAGLLAAVLVSGLVMAGCTASEPTSPDPPPLDRTVPDATAVAPAPRPGEPTTITGVEGLSERIAAFLGASRWGRYDRISAVLVTVDGRTVAEWHRPELSETPREVAGVSAAVLVALTGILLERGAFGADGLAAARRPLEQVLAAPLPGPVTELLATRPGASLHDLLVGTSLDDTAALGAVLTAAAGRPVPDLARELLFGPLGIDPPWTPAGPAVTAGDMARLGALWLDRGQVEGRQLVPAAWIDSASRPYTQTGRRRLPYAGYRLWVTRADGHAAVVLTGIDGQLVEIVPGLDLVVVVASGEDPDPEVALPAGSEAYVELVTSLIVPAIG
jgi:hypothetical protein